MNKFMHMYTIYVKQYIFVSTPLDYILSYKNSEFFVEPNIL